MAREVIERDYSSWSGKILERFFHDLYAAGNKDNRIGSYWERGNKNEIDLVAVNDLRKELVMAEIKRNKSRISLPALQHKAERLLQEYQGTRWSIVLWVWKMRWSFCRRNFRDPGRDHEVRPELGKGRNRLLFE